jgi:hypothetical protein
MLEASESLDRRVAEALGCTLFDAPRGPECGCGGYPHGRPYPHNDLLKGYSTAACYVGEMLEWAAAQDAEPYIYFTSAGPWEARVYLRGDWHYSCGDTPATALARAIVAAAEPPR